MSDTGRQVTFTIKGTPKALINKLVDEFELSQDEARLFVMMQLASEYSTPEKIDENELALWYLNSSKDKYQTPIANTRYSISFTGVNKNLLETFVHFLVTLKTSGVKIAAIAGIIDILLSMYNNTTHIEDSQCCVYFQALKWRKEHGSQNDFRIHDLFPPYKDPDSQEHECGYTDRTWKCTHCPDGVCDITEPEFTEIFNTLVGKDNVFVYCKNGKYNFGV